MIPLTYREERELLKREMQTQKLREDLLVLAGVAITFALFVLGTMAFSALQP